uniref:Ig-like domain-containing protein n=1 Tax=Anopheles atroparvus TaxID=41427 RepID=A0A182JA51_ANOAO
MLLILFCLLGSTSAWYETGDPWSSTNRPRPQALRPQWGEPYFDLAVSRNVTVREGETAFLTCRVENLAQYSISWVRHHDLHILAINWDTFISDERFQALHNKQTEEWTLKIKRTRRKDTGIYECQISTMPVKSLQLYLIVLDESELVRRQDDILYDIPPSSGEQHLPEGGRKAGDVYNRMYADRVNAATTQILEGTMVYGYKGQNVNLTCIVNYNYAERPNHIVWYHHNEIVAYESLRKRERSSLNSITSYHTIRNTEFDDAGNYTCAPEQYASASTIVHILDGEEALEHSSASIGERISTAMKLFVSLSILYNHRDRMS